MHWPLRVATPAILILPVVRDKRGVYALYCGGEGKPGLVVNTQARFFLRDQVVMALEAHLGAGYTYEPYADFFMQAQLRDMPVSVVLVSISGAVSKVTDRLFSQFCCGAANTGQEP